MVGKDIYTNYGMVGLMEWPDEEARQSGPTERRGCPAIPNGRAGQTDTRTGAQQRVDGRPMEGARVPDGEREWPDGGRDGCPTEGRVSGVWPNGGPQGWPNEGLYKCCWPSFLGTLLLHPVALARNAGARGANE
jgi:hypothetical protein